MLCLIYCYNFLMTGESLTGALAGAQCKRTLKLCQTYFQNFQSFSKFCVLFNKSLRCWDMYCQHRDSMLLAVKRIMKRVTVILAHPQRIFRFLALVFMLLCVIVYISILCILYYTIYYSILLAWHGRLLAPLS